MQATTSWFEEYSIKNIGKIQALWYIVITLRKLCVLLHVERS